MIEERDEFGRLIYASRSNSGAIQSALFPGRRRCVPHTARGNHTASQHMLIGDWPFIPT